MVANAAKEFYDIENRDVHKADQIDPPTGLAKEGIHVLAKFKMVPASKCHHKRVAQVGACVVCECLCWGASACAVFFLAYLVRCPHHSIRFNSP